VAITAAFAGGIALADNGPAWLSPWGLLFVLGVAWTASLLARMDRVSTVSAVLVFATLGALYVSAFEQREVRWPDLADGRGVTGRVLIHAPPEPAPVGWRAIARLQAVTFGEREPRRPRGQRPAARAGPSATHEAVGSSITGLVRLTGRGRSPALRVGDEVAIRGRFRAGRLAGNPGERGERQALRRRGLVGVIAVDPMGGVTVERSGGLSLRGAIAKIRGRALDAILQALPPPRSGLLLSLLLGVETHLPPEVYQQFSRAGLIHLMVVSGTQVAIVAGALSVAARLARLPPWVSAIAITTCVMAFTAVVGWAPSIGRAVLMTLVAAAGTLVGRERDRGATLAAAALSLLALYPSVLFDIGFQLSFAATWGLLFIAPALRRRVAGLGPRLSGALAVTLGAQAAVAPLLAAHFQSIPLGGIVANLLALPIVAVLVPVGFAVLPLTIAVPAVGAPLLRMIAPGLDALMWIGARFADVPWAMVVTPPVPSVMVVAVYAALGAAVAVSAGSWRPSRAQRATAWAVIVVCVGGWYEASARPPSLLTVTVLDVGQGDAILVQSPSGRTVLIDAGGEIGAERTGWDVGRMRVVPALRRAAVRRVDVVMLSHPHEDHVGGLPAVVENFPVGLVLDPGVPHPSPSYARFLRLIEARRIPYRQARDGLRVELGAGVALSILHPSDAAPPLEGDQVHARGTAARLTYGSTAMLLTGDVEAPVERYLIERGLPLASQVLKVGHHGSRTSTSVEFVARVRPQIAVISLGADNAFGHPHAVTIDVLTTAGAAIYRTDRDGAVQITSDGTAVRASTYRGAVGAGVR